MTKGCEGSNLEFSPCADCSYEFQPKGCREHRKKIGSRIVAKPVRWETYKVE